MPASGFGGENSNEKMGLWELKRSTIRSDWVGYGRLWQFRWGIYVNTKLLCLHSQKLPFFLRSWFVGCLYGRSATGWLVFGCWIGWWGFRAG